MLDQYYADARLQRLANEVLIRHQLKTGRQLALPISASDILDDTLSDELRSVLWDKIECPPGTTVLAGLAPDDRQIVLNEEQRDLIVAWDGLENDLIAHEIGHWLLHVNRGTLGTLALPGVPRVVSIVCKGGVSFSRGEKNANRFMGYLLMPESLLVPLASSFDLRSWPSMFRLRQELDVTITALRIRLEELGFAYVDEGGRIHGSRREATGQRRLF